jgi:hypothetical protein
MPVETGRKSFRTGESLQKVKGGRKWLTEKSNKF